MTVTEPARLVCAAAAVAFLLPAVASAGGDRTIDWHAVKPISGRVDGDAVRITGTAVRRSYPLVVIHRPGVSGRYAVEGHVRYAGVEGIAFLELWSVFADGSRFFTRTLATTGPLQSITGNSDWRPFALPFDAAGGRPVRLEINLVLPGRGAVWVGALRLGPDVSPSSWWSDRTAGIAGAALGIAIGLLGAFVGWAIARGRSRRLVVGVCAVCTVVGIALLAVALVALLRDQPYAVWFPLLLSGGLLASIFGSATHRARITYAGIELRRMRAMDA